MVYLNAVHLIKNLGVDGRTVLKHRREVSLEGVDYNHLAQRQEPVGSSYEHGSELSGAIKGVERWVVELFKDFASRIQLLLIITSLSCLSVGRFIISYWPKGNRPKDAADP
jgi:hypothetical protein